MKKLLTIVFISLFVFACSSDKPLYEKTYKTSKSWKNQHDVKKPKKKNNFNKPRYR